MLASTFHKPLSFGVVTTRISSSFLPKVPYKNFIQKIRMGTNQNSILRGSSSNSRGALVVLEGLDRCGKTTQSSRLVQYLEGLGHSAELWRFPDRTTSVGQMISSYLSNESQLDDHTIHLLFSANRWEKRSLMETKLKGGTTLILDRYSYSGVAFSCAKGLGFEWCKVVSRPANEALIVPFSLEEIWRAIKSLGKKRLLGLRRLWTFLGVLNLNGTQLEGQMDWGFSFETPFAALTCYLHISKRLSFGPIGQSTFLMAPEVGLLTPDLVLYLDISPERAAERGGYGGERYEQIEFQNKVAKCYQLLVDSKWQIIDACRPMEDIEKELQEIVLDCVKRCQNGEPLSHLWSS